MDTHDSTVKWLLVAAIVVWALIVLVSYVGYHPEHLRPYYHLMLFCNDLFVFVFLVMLSLGFGRFVLVRLFRWKGDTLLVEMLASFGAGFALLSYTAMVLGFLGLLRFSVVITILILFFIAGAFEIKHFVRRFISSAPREFRTLCSGFLVGAMLVIIGFQVVMNFTESLTPPYEWDTLSYHLLCQKEYIEAGKIIKLPFIHQSYYACGTELVYGICLLLRTQIAPKLLHCFFGLMILGLIYEMGRSFINRFAGLLAAMIFYTCPIPVWFSGVGKNDLATIFFVTFAMYAFIRWWQGLETDRGECKSWFVLLIVFTAISMHVGYRCRVLAATIAFFLLIRIVAGNDMSSLLHLRRLVV